MVARSVVYKDYEEVFGWGPKTDANIINTYVSERQRALSGGYIDILYYN